MKKLILIALACSISICSHANNDGETRSTTVTMEITPSDLISIDAKNTELVVETWSKSEVEIEATIRFDGKMTDKMEKFLNNFESHVRDNISYSNGELRVNSDIDIPNKVQIGNKNVGINISFGDDELKILYSIKAPGMNKYEISNSYEDMQLIGAFSKIDIKQYSGDLEVEKVEKAVINLKYGSATIQEIGEAKMEIYEQELNVSNIGILTINAKYSDMEFEIVDRIDATAYESDFQINKIKTLNGNFKYGEINIGNNLIASKLVLYEMEIEAEEIGSLILENSKYSKYDIAKIDLIEFGQSYEDEIEIGNLGSFKSLNSKYGNHQIDFLEGKLELNAYEDDIEIDRVAPGATTISIDGKYIESYLGVSNISYKLLANVKYGKVDYDESDVEVKRYIKESDQLEVELHAKKKSDNPISITVKGYEVDVRLN